MTISKLPTYAWEFDGNLNAAVGGVSMVNLSGYPAVTYTTGKTGQALDEFCAVETASAFNFPTGNKWSMSVWSKMTTGDTAAPFEAPPSLSPPLMSIRGDADGNIGYLYYGPGPASTTPTASLGSVWRHVVATFDSGTLKHYVDAALISTTSVSAWTVAGKKVCSANGGPTDQLALWTADCLTTDDIAYIYNSGNGRAYATWEETPPAAGNFRRSSNVFSNRLSMRR